jgi:hypothetical protein
MDTLYASSLEYVRVPVRAEKSGAAYAPTGDTVQLAFLTSAAAPSGGDWKTASWDTDSSTYPATYWAQCLVGPGGTTTLTAGVWTVWVKVTDSPEVPVKRAGQIKVV